MANTKSAAKRARQNERRTLKNRRSLTAVKNSLKSVRAAITAGGKDQAKALAQKCASTVDKAAKSGRLHKNAANRQKSKIARALATLA